ncbi:MAG: hypothetical protein KC777_18640 [Cyanobacteria bacterium HKST-UBA02]|nr:hypothetical protein [Cyanobacteria bacterium HKST-UBA02]
MNNDDNLKIQHDCAHNCDPGTASKLGERGKAMEDHWFREHEHELMEAARARKLKEVKAK